MADAVARIRSGQPKKFEPIAMRTIYDAWIQEVERTCKPRTVRDYQERWENHLEAAFGHMLASQVTRDSVASYLFRRKKEGAGPITQNRKNRVLQMIFSPRRVVARQGQLF
jgi:hypothetical protein